MGVEETLNVCSFNNRISTVTLRTNTLKMGREELMERLRDKGLTVLPGSFSPEGILLADPPPLSELPFLNEGLFIIQDEASQLVTRVLDPKPGESILDACAAPGGKTTHIAQRMENKGEVYALDLTSDKLALIGELCKRLGVTTVKRLKGDATRPLPVPEGMTFDRLLADVPCSGFGTLRKNPDLKWRKGEADIKRLSTLQSAILDHLSGYVKNGGLLVYSTCTVFREENEEAVENFLKAHPEFQLDPIADCLPEICGPLIKGGYLNTIPHKTEMDGFFIARMKKQGRC
jgi:16S rRNA (cytosine967-C5)-methyltransferase